MSVPNFFNLFNEYREQIKDDSRATLYEKLKQREAKFREVEKAYFGLAKVTLLNLPLMELSSAIYWLLMSQVILIWILVLLYPCVPITHAETPDEFKKNRFFVFPFEANSVFQKIIVETPWLLHVGLGFYLALHDENPINFLISSKSSESLVFKNYHFLSLWLGIGYVITFLERCFFQSILKSNKPIG